jgi:hypothetical protein
MHWHSYEDISYHLQARADTSNNAVFDETTGEWISQSFLSTLFEIVCLEPV